MYLNCKLNPKASINYVIQIINTIPFLLLSFPPKFLCNIHTTNYQLNPKKDISVSLLKLYFLIKALLGLQLEATD